MSSPCFERKNSGFQSMVKIMGLSRDGILCLNDLFLTEWILDLTHSWMSCPWHGLVSVGGPDATGPV